MRVVMLLAVLVAACATSPKHDVGPQPNALDPPIGQILSEFALRRSMQECKEHAVSSVNCSATLAKAEAHLQTANERLAALLKDPRTNLCDLVRWAGSCNNPIYTVGDLADCIESSAERGEAMNSGRFPMALDSKGCPTDRK